MHFIIDIGLFFLACIIITLATCHFNAQLTTYRLVERLGYVKGKIDLTSSRYVNNSKFNIQHFKIMVSQGFREVVVVVFLLAGFLLDSLTLFGIGIILAICDTVLMMYGFRNRYVYRLRENLVDVRHGFIDALRQYRFYELMYWVVVTLFLFSYGHLIPL